MKILVTGASGFLGKKLCDRLKKAGHEIVELHSKNGDLTKDESLSFFSHVRFAKIFHLAAWTQAGDFCLRHPGDQWLINQKIHTHVLDFWIKHQPQAKLISIGTSCGYDPELPLREENYLKGIPIDSLFTYAMTKRMLLAGLIAAQKQYGLNYLYLIPSTLYGPGYHTDGRQLHFIFDLIRKILNGVYHDKPVKLWGDGFQKRELIHVEDFLTIMLDLAQKEKNCWVNVGSGEEYSIRQFAESICKRTGYLFEKIEFDISKYVGARSKVLNIEKLKTLMPSLKLKPLDEGLEETIQWFSEVFFPHRHTQALIEPKCMCEKVPG